MLILERAITHKHWSVIRDQILKKLSRDKFQRIKNTEVIRIDNTQNTITYTVLDGADPVAWLYLYKKRTWYTWEVLQVFVLPSHRGKKLASTLYQAAVNCDNIMISSGEICSCHVVLIC
jgi:GNAT superfamily N-acetyltransferase